jgi:hypothetical protein
VIVARERAKDSYSTGPYLTAKLAAELPIGTFYAQALRYQHLGSIFTTLLYRSCASA